MDKITITFHENAKPSINSKADRLLKAIEEPPETPDGVLSEVITTLPLGVNANHIREEHITQKNWRGERGVEIARFIRIGPKLLGLTGPSYQEAVVLVEQIAKLAIIREYVSNTKIMELLFGWISLRGSGSTNTSFVEHLEHMIPQEVHHFSMMFPLIHLEAEENFTIGSVHFENINQDYFKRLRAVVHNDSERSKAEIDRAIRELSNMYSGTLCAIVEVTGDEYRSKQIGRDRVGQALDILRFYSPTVTHPEFPCVFDLKGQDNVQQSEILIIVDGNTPIHNQSIDGFAVYPVRIGASTINNLKRRNLDAIASIFSNPIPTELENEAMNGLRQFAQAIKMQRAEERLVLLFVVLEMLLLVNDNEPITQTLGLRLAFLIGNDAEERVRITQNITQWYGVRSGFIHHGRRRCSLYDLKEIQLLVQRAVAQIFVLTSSFQTKQQLVDDLKAKLFS